MLLIGDSGAGKTGCLASLAKAGYNLYIIDMDNGLDILYHLLKDDKEALGRIDYATFRDPMKAGPAGPIRVAANAYSKALKYMTDWPEKGPLEKWTDKDILVVDSLSFLCDAAMAQAKMADGKLHSKTEVQHWGWAMENIKMFLSLVTSDAVMCNVIITAHVTHIESQHGGIIKAFPKALGQKLPPEVASYFNTAVQVRARGSGNNLRREILTRSEGLLDLKTPIFDKVPSVMPAETGLADFFETYRKGNSNA